MKRKILFILGLTGVLLFILTDAHSQTLGQTDTFQDGTLNSWSSGVPNPTPPINISTGGPKGSNDRYVRVISSGGFGPGSKLVLSNTNQWKGNYISAGIGNIHMFLKNEGSTGLQMRIAILSASGSCSSVNPISVPVGSGWIAVNFPLSASALTGGPVNTILTSVTEIRILHKTTPGTSGDAIIAQLGIDSITATAALTNVADVPSESPQLFTLFQNYPNPFNPSTVMSYELPVASSVRLKVFDLLGREVATLVNAEMEVEGMHSIQFNATGLSSGVYFYRLEAGKNVQIKRLVLLK